MHTTPSVEEAWDRHKDVRPGNVVKLDTCKRRVICRAIIAAPLRVMVVYRVESSGVTYICPIDELTSTKPATQQNNSNAQFRPGAGTHWRNHENERFRVVTCAWHTGSGKLYVVLRADLDNIVWACSLETWCTSVTINEKPIPRFASIP